MSWLPNIAFDPLISPLWIGVILAIAIVAAAIGGVARLRSFILRVLSALFLTLALMNPQTVEEERDSLPDEVLVIVDTSESAQLGGRDAKIEAILGSLNSEINAAENLETTLVRTCLLYTSPSPRDKRQSRMPSSA